MKNRVISKIRRGMPRRITEHNVWGVTIAICCHNSALRLPQTLAHLAAQKVRTEVPWEVIVIDNGSADGTSRIAATCWPENALAPLRVCFEPELGLSYARCRAFEEARYEIVSFVDDDNWVLPNWVQLVADVMSKRADVGACGGYAEARSEIDQPPWFGLYREWYAVGPQADHEGDITWSRGYLWGAGLSVRRCAWQQLITLGFRFLLMDRRGTELCSGGDSELCLALRLVGWRLWYEPRLKFYHYIPASRLQWRYLRKALRGIGAASPSHKAYQAVQQHNSPSLKAWFAGKWSCQVIVSFIKLMVRFCQLLFALPHGSEGNRAVLNLDCRIGEICQLLRTRDTYNLHVRRVRQTFQATGTQACMGD
jgi:glycosyltransferase involved in cell wall biosynthesis